MKRYLTASVAMVLSFAPIARAQDIPAEYQQVLTALGKQGDYKANVLKVNIPRNDLSVTVAGVKTPTPFGFGGWVAMTKGTDGMDVMMGDLVLTQDEVNPVMRKLKEGGIEITALHNHLLRAEPMTLYMHIQGHGDPVKLAGAIHDGLALSKTPFAPPPGTATPGNIDMIGIDRIMGYFGQDSGGIYQFGNLTDISSSTISGNTAHVPDTDRSGGGGLFDDGLVNTAIPPPSDAEALPAIVTAASRTPL